MVILTVIFQLVNLGSIAPVLKQLFIDKENISPAKFPELSFSANYVKGLYNWFNYFLYSQENYSSKLKYLCLLVLGGSFLHWSFYFLSRVIIAHIKARMVRKLRNTFFEKINRMSMSFFSNEKRGDLISRMTNDIQEVENSMIASLNGVLVNPITVIFTFIALFNIHVELTLFSVIVLPLLAGAVGFVVSKIRQRAKRSQRLLGNVLEIIDEALDGIKIIKSFNMQQLMNDRFRRENSFYERTLRSIDIRKALASALSQILGIGIFAVVLYYGGLKVASGELSGDVFVAYLLLFGSVISPLKGITTTIGNVQRGLVAGKRVFNILDLPEEIIETNKDSIPINKIEKGISFNNVSFAYEEQDVLSNINLNIEVGKTVALVGPSGGGKSTLADLVPRFYDINNGTILIDDLDIKDIELNSLRDKIGIVTQDSVLFNDSIYNNIAFGKQDASQEEVENAAKIANAHDFIMKSENGYDTNIGDRGNKLSGGQKQRLSIARAVLKNPPVMILDEATSALDTESEKLVQEALDKLMQNRTSIVIAHRLSTIQKADEIIVIKKGEIVERGTHQSLVELGGVYADLSKSQAL